MKKQLFLYFFVIAIFKIGFVQSFADRITLQIGAAGHGINRAKEVGTLSLAFNMYYRLSKQWGVGLRYDHQVHQFGLREHEFLSSRRYRILGSDLRNMNSLTLTPQINFLLFKTNVAVAGGVGFYQLNKVADKYFTYPQNKLSDIYWSNPINHLGYSFSISAYYQKIQSGVILNYIKKPKRLFDTNLYASVFLNYSIINGRNTILKNKSNKTKNDLPFMILGAGIQPMSNLGKYAGALNIYFESQFAILENASIGFRTNSKTPAPVGFDDNATPHTQGRELFTHNTQTMEKIYARIFIGNYYFPKNNGWYFVSTGLGFFHRNSSEEIKTFDLKQNPITIPGSSHQKNFGGLLGIGFKTGIYRFSLEYNFTGKNIPDYLAMQMGIEANFFTNKK